MRLQGQVAIVTGGGRGIGRSTAIALAREGAKIVAASRTRSELEQTAAEVGKLGSECLIVPTDLRRADQTAEIVNATISAYNQIDILINNAGTAVKKPLLETMEAELDETLDVNLKAPFLMSQKALPHMIRRRKGVIVNVSSGLGKSGYPGLSAYSASKFGLIGITESLAEEVLAYGIRVYVVCPGGVDTKMHRDLFPDENATEMIRPEKIAEKIVLLCLPDCKVRSGSSVEIYH